MHSPVDLSVVAQIADNIGVSHISHPLFDLPFVAWVASLRLNIKTAVASLNAQAVEMLEPIKNVTLENMTLCRVYVVVFLFRQSQR